MASARIKKCKFSRCWMVASRFKSRAGLIYSSRALLRHAGTLISCHACESLICRRFSEPPPTLGKEESHSIASNGTLRILSSLMSIFTYNTHILTHWSRYLQLETARKLEQDHPTVERYVRYCHCVKSELSMLTPSCRLQRTATDFQKVMLTMAIQCFALRWTWWWPSRRASAPTTLSRSSCSLSGNRLL